ncbi:MAG: acyltransferase [Ferruginibacter sp.]
MNRFISQKFRFFSFVCIALLMFVHGYNLKQGYLQPYSMVNEELTFTTFIEYFLANGALRFRIPMLFIISGYIFAQRDHRPYAERVRNRFSTLMIPYFSWSAVGLAITFLLQQFPFTAQLVRDATIDQLGDNRPYTEIGWGGILHRWILAPASFQLWFIRSLFIYNMLYPVFKWVVTRYPAIWFTGLFLLWYFGFQYVYIEGQGMLFFSLGIWLNKTNYPIDKKPEWYSHYLGWLFFIGVSIIKTFMAFELEVDTTVSFWSTSAFWMLISLHTITILAGIMAVWYGSDDLVRWCMRRKWFVWATSFSFVIYGLHVPVIQYITMYLFTVFGYFPYYRLLVYFLAPVIVLAICIGTGKMLRSLAPKLYRIMTGGRGF